MRWHVKMSFLKRAHEKSTGQMLFLAHILNFLHVMQQEAAPQFSACESAAKLQPAREKKGEVNWSVAGGF